MSKKNNKNNEKNIKVDQSANIETENTAVNDTETNNAKINNAKINNEIITNSSGDKSSNQEDNTDSSAKPEKAKKSYLGQIILFAVLATFIAPVLLGGGGGNAVLRIGNSYIQENEIKRANLLAQQDFEYPEFFYWFFFLREDAFYFNDGIYANLGRSPFGGISGIFGLTATKEQVDEHIAQNPLFMQNGKFDQDQYREMLKRIGATDAVYRSEIANWIATKSLFYLMLKLLPEQFYKGVNLDAYVNKIAKAFTQKRTGSYSLANIDSDLIKEPTTEDMKDYYTTHTNEFEQSAQAEVLGVRFDNISDTDLKALIEELRAGVSYKDAGKHLQRTIFRGVMRDNRLYSGDNLSESFAMKVASEAKPKNLNKLSLHHDTDSQTYYVYLISDYIAPSLKKFEDVQDELKEKVILKQKLELVKEGKAKLGASESFAVELKDVLPAQYPNYRGKDKKPLTELVERAGWEIFKMSTKLDQKATSSIIVNDKVYVVKLTGISEQALDSQTMDNIKKAIKQSILGDILGVYVESIARSYGVEQY